VGRQSLANPTLDQILAAKRRWKVAAVALTYRLHDLHIINDWRYRLLVKQLSRLGYRRSEPNGIDRESSQLLHKVFSVLRAEPGGWSGLLKDIQLNDEELSRHVFGLVPVGVGGGGETSLPVRPKLEVISGGLADGARTLRSSPRTQSSVR
jgi:hypothetical protein